jgi:hypothetical protein
LTGVAGADCPAEEATSTTISGGVSSEPYSWLLIIVVVTTAVATLAASV